MDATPRIGDLVEIVTAEYAVPGVRGHLARVDAGDAEPYLVHGLGGLFYYASAIGHPAPSPAATARRMRRRRTPAA
ncbi:hypothetical protein ACFW81_23825 [Streptomyces angustmyceticus]|uniref:hypothetical protein n=1 Tax=Streptomyces angustmyceticus TaxID=285578 RepID=UPI0036B2A042